MRIPFERMRKEALFVALFGVSCAGVCRPTPGAVVHLTRDGAPVPGIHVLFSSPTGEVIVCAKTDAEGRAEAEVPAGGAITVATLDRRFGTRELLTMLGIETSDRIELKLETYQQPPVTARLDVGLPGPFGDARSYRVTAGCASRTATSATSFPMFAIDPRCLEDGKVDITASALDPSGHPLAYTFMANRSLAATGTTSLSLPAWRTDLFPVALSVLNPPGDVDRAWATLDVESNELTMVGDTGRPPFDGRLLVPSALAERLAVTYVERFGSSGTRITSELEVRSSAIELDAIELLPRVTDLVWETGESGTAFQWKLDADPIDADGVWLGASWGSPKPKVNWTFVLPPHLRSARTPKLPPELSEWSPADRPKSAVITVFDRASITHWSQVRTRPTESMREAVVRGRGESALRFSQLRR
jgi:hypothetical protein